MSGNTVQIFAAGGRAVLGDEGAQIILTPPPRITITTERQGPAGPPGPSSPGEDGASAYEVAVANGFEGDEAAWLLSLKGDPGEDGAPGADSTVPGPAGSDGASAYEIAVANGFEGDEAAWLLSLKGDPGDPGEDGAPGADSTVPGPAGSDGASAYEIAVAHGFFGDEAAWLLSLRGEQGDPGAQGAQGLQGESGADGNDGVDGVNGASAYEVAVANGFEGDEAAWLLSLKGDPGEDGDPGADGVDGASAYEVAVENGFVGDEAAWLLSLKGDPGDPGEDGAPGADSTVPGPAGTDGTDGREVEFQNSGTYIQWRYVGEATWTNLVALADITGPPGEDGSGGSGNVTVAVRSSDFSDSTGTLSDVSGLSFSVGAGETVLAEIRGYQYGNASGSGLKIAFTGPASPTHVRYNFRHWTATSVIRTMDPATAFGTEISEGSGVTIELDFAVVLTLTNGANAGTVQFQAASESGATSVTITRGATLRVFRAP